MPEIKIPDNMKGKVKLNFDPKSMRILFYDAIREVLENQSWKGFWTLTFSEDKRITENDGKFLSECRSTFFEKISKNNSNLKVFWVYEGPPTTKNWHIHFLSSEFIPEAYAKETWANIVKSVNYNSHYMAGATVIRVKTKEEEDLLPQDHWIDYILKDIAIQDVEIKQHLKGAIQIPYGFVGSKEFKEEYKKIKNKIVDKLYEAELKFERDQNNLRTEKFKINPDFNFLKEFIKSRKVEFSEKLNAILTNFISQSSKYRFIQEKLEDGKIFINKLKEAQKTIGYDFIFVFLNLFLQRYSRQQKLVNDVKLIRAEFDKQVFTLFITLLYEDHKKEYLRIEKIFEFYKDFGISLADQMIDLFNDVFKNLFEIKLVTDVEDDFEDGLRDTKRLKSLANRFEFKVLNEEPEFISNLEKYLDNYTVTNKYPMIFEPKPWNFKIGLNHFLQDDNSGSYLLNGEEINIPACRTWQSHKLAVKDETLAEVLSYIQSRPFKVDYEMLDYINSSDCDLFISKELAEYHNNLKEELSKRSDVDIAKKDKKHYISKQNEIIGEFKEQQLVFDSFKRIKQRGAYYVWFPIGLDFRTRIVPISEVNPMTSKICRTLLRHSTPMEFNLDVFKYNAVKLYLKNKISFQDAIKYFDSERFDRRMFHFKDDQSIFIDANEPYAMLGACFEWVRYVDFCNKPDYNRFKRYRSYYLMGVDATSSGHQILSMIMNDGTYQKELNLAVSEDLYTEEPSHYYTSMAREYLEEAKEKKSLVAEKLLKLENYEVYYNEHRKADEFKKLTKNDVEKIALNTILIPLFKPLLMKGVYNATKFTFKKDVEEHIDKQFRLSLDKIKMGFRSTHTFLEKDFINELTNSMWQKKNETTMSYYIEIMKKISQTFSDHGLQIKWLTRTGGYVFQMYNKLELTPTWKSIPTFLQTYKKVSKDRLPNTSKVQVSEELRKMRQAQKIYIPNLTDEIDKRKMINATPPSFIHSLDADIIFEFSKYMMKLPYLSFFLVHDTIDFPHSYYSKIMLMLAKANHAIFAETKNKEGKTMLELFLDNLLDILQSHSPAAKKDADKLREEISNLLKEAEKVSEKQFDYSALMYSRIYY